MDFTFFLLLFLLVLGKAVCCVMAIIVVFPLLFKKIGYFIYRAWMIVTLEERELERNYQAILRESELFRSDVVFDNEGGFSELGCSIRTDEET